MGSFKLIPLEERIVLDAAAAVHVIYVNGALHNNGDGSLSHPYNNLQAALSDAASHKNNQIDVAAGTYLPTLGIDNTNSNQSLTFNIPNNTTLLGGFNSTFTQRDPTHNATILSGDIGQSGVSADNSYTVVSVGKGVTASLDGFIVQGGNNTVTGLGGGLAAINASSLSLANMQFLNDSANNSGGGIYASGLQTLTINTSIFTNDSAQSFGGAIAAQSIGSALIISNSTFTNDSVTNYHFNNGEVGPGRGGGIFTQHDVSVTIQQDIFKNDSATKGGAFFTTGDQTVNMIGNSVINCTAFVGGGAEAIKDANLNVSNNAFNGNTAEFAGAGFVSFLSQNANVSLNVFDSNSIPLNPYQSDLARAGALWLISDQKATASQNTFTNNTIVGSLKAVGGAIVVQFEQSVSILNNYFANNSATSVSGMPGNSFGGAIAEGYGGMGGTVLVQGNTFYHNSAEFGGAVDSSLETATFKNNTFTNNYASNGGALQIERDTLVVIDSNLFSGNTAILNGGAIADGGAYTNGPSESMTITNNTFSSNNAASGPGIWLDGGETTVNQAKLSDPNAVISQLVNNNNNLLSNDITIY